jgi:hypothetical protein
VNKQQIFLPVVEEAEIALRIVSKRRGLRGEHRPGTGAPMELL